MTHLRIELNTIPENVTSNIIHKLYKTAKAIIDAEEANDVQESLVSLKGNLLTTIAYDDEVQWLIDKFGPELSINVTLGRAIKFEDPNMLAYLNNLGIGSNGYITKPDAAAATVVANSGNSAVTKFNELKYFTNITGSSGGFNGDTAGVIKFKGWSALLEIDISNFTSIGHNTGYRYEDTFMECSALTTVKASNKLSAIGHCAFRLCGNLETITGLSGTITLSAGYLFYGCSKLQDSSFLNVLIKFGSDIGTDNFMSCGLLTAIALDPTTTIIPDRCFRDCSALTTVTGTNNIETIGIGAFLNTAISSINIPNAVTIGNEAFKSCAQLQSISIPNATSIGTQAFLRSGITSADISSVTSIPEHCFNTCEHLTTVTGTPLSINEGAFLNCYVLNTINLSNVTTIGQQSFFSCRALLAINLSSITEIGSLAFLGCSGLTSVITGSSNFTIGPNAFAACGELTTIDLSNCTSIGGYAFIHDRKLVTSDLSSCTSVRESAFLNCSSLTSLDLSSCTTIGSNAFNGCTLLTSVDLSSCTSIGANAFNGCTSLTNIGTDLSNCTYISYDNVFYNCPITNDIVIQGQDFANNNPLGAGSFIGTRIRSLTARNNLNVGTRLFGGRNSGNKSAFGNNPNLLFVDLSLSDLTTASTSGYTFDNDSSLKWVKYPESFIKFGKSEFSRCTSLEAVVLPAQQVVESVIALNSYGAHAEMHSLWNTGMQQPSMLRLYVPDSLINDYKLHYAWSEYADIIKPMSELPDLLAMISST